MTRARDSERTAGQPQSPDGAELAARISEAWRRFRSDLDYVGLRRLRRPTPVGWSYAALVAHVAAWHDETSRRLAIFRETGAYPGPPPDVDAFNARAAEAAARRSPEDLLAGLQPSLDRLVGEVHRLTREQVGRNDRWAESVVAGNTYDHYEEHRGELAAARPCAVRALLTRLDEDWAVFRAGVGNVAGRLHERLADDGSSWTYHDVVAHAAAWLEEGPRLVEELRRGARRRFDSRWIDDFNARAVEACSRTAPAALLTQLDDSFRAHRAASAALTDEEVRDLRFLEAVAWTSYLHWDEHLRDLPAEPR